MPDVQATLFGFSSAEANGRWTDGELAEISLPLGSITDPFLLVVVELSAFISGDRLPEQRVIVSFDGVEIETLSIHERIFRKRVLVAKRDGDRIQIKLQLPFCLDPASLGLNADRRRLGVLVRRLVVEGIAEYPAVDWPLWESGHRLVGIEAAKSWDARLLSGFWARFVTGRMVLDIGFRGERIHVAPILEGAIGIDLDYPGYDGRTLPFPDGSQDAVFSSHCLEHIPGFVNAIQDWFRVIRLGGHIITVVPSAHLYERGRRPPSHWNPDHQRFYTPASLLAEFEMALIPNSYRVRLLEENDVDYDYRQPHGLHPGGAYEIMLVIQKIELPAWSLGT